VNQALGLAYWLGWWSDGLQLQFVHGQCCSTSHITFLWGPGVVSIRQLYSDANKVCPGGLCPAIPLPKALCFVVHLLYRVPASKQQQQQQQQQACSPAASEPPPQQQQQEQQQQAIMDTAAEAAALLMLPHVASVALLHWAASRSPSAARPENVTAALELIYSLLDWDPDMMPTWCADPENNPQGVIDSNIGLQHQQQQPERTASQSQSSQCDSEQSLSEGCQQDTMQWWMTGELLEQALELTSTFVQKFWALLSSGEAAGDAAAAAAGAATGPAGGSISSSGGGNSSCQSTTVTSNSSSSTAA